MADTGTDLTSAKKIWSIAWPNAVTHILFILLHLVDLFWVGKWGGDAPINAMAIVGPFILAIQGGANLVFFGMLAMISRFAGSNDKKSAATVGRQGILVALFIGLMIAMAGILWSDVILRVYKTTPEINSMAVDYMTILFAGNLIFFLYMAFFAIFSSYGNTKVPMLMTLIAWAVNFALDPIFIFGWFGLPSMGIKGAAWATFISYVAAFIGFVIFFWKPLLRYVPISGIKDFRPHWRVIKEIIRIGAPASVSGISRPLSTTAIMIIVTQLGTTVVAAMGIVIRIASIIWVYLGGLSTASSSLVGQNLGAGDPKGAQQTVFRTWSIGITVQLVITSLFLFYSRELVSIFTHEPNTIQEASVFLKIMAFVSLADVFSAVYGGALNGAGDTFRAMTSSIIANWIYKIPVVFLVFYLFSHQVVMIYWVIALSLVIEGLIHFFWYKRGRWKTKIIRLD